MKEAVPRHDTAPHIHSTMTTKRVIIMAEAEKEGFEL